MSSLKPKGDDLLITASEHWRFAIVQLIEICSVLKNSPFDCWSECHDKLWDTYGHGDTTVDVSYCAVFVTTDYVTRMIVREKQWAPVVTWSCVRDCKRPLLHTSGIVNWSEMYFIKTGFQLIVLLAWFVSYNFGDSCEYAVITRTKFCFFLSQCLPSWLCVRNRIVYHLVKHF